MTVQEQALSSFLQKPDNFVTTVTAVLFNRYGTDYFVWDPVTLAQQIQVDFGFPPDDSFLDKAQTGITLFTNPGAFFTTLEVFGQMVNVLAHENLDAARFIPPDADDCAWGCLEAKLLLGSDYIGTFSDNIAYYVGSLLEQEGMQTPPDILKFAKYPSGSPDIDMNDENMYQAWYRNQEEKVDEFEVALNRRFVTLLEQLKEMPLGKGIDTSFVDRMLNRLEKTVYEVGSKQ